MTSVESIGRGIQTFYESWKTATLDGDYSSHRLLDVVGNEIVLRQNLELFRHACQTP